MYILPQALVFQEFELLPVAITDPLRACIVAPQYDLFRYGVAAEKSQISLGEYDPLNDAAYSWPQRAAGTIVDPGYTKVFIDNALLQYFHGAVGLAIKAVEDYPNRVRFPSTVLKTDNGSDRDATLYDRDVAVGDVIKLVGGACDMSTELETYILGFVADVVAATVGSAVVGTGNESTTSATSTIEQTAGDENHVFGTPDETNYDGLADGCPAELYTVEVVQGSTDEDATTAILRVTSASGRDDVAEVVPYAFGEPTAIGLRGLEVTFENSSSEVGVTADFIVGQTWEIAVEQTFVKPTAASDGDFTGDLDDTYIVEVTRGGKWANSPTVRCYNARGTDVSGPTVVETATPLNVGTKGVTIALTSATGLCTGDTYTIAVTAATEGAVKTAILAHNVPDAFFGICEGSSDEDGIPALDTTLYIRKNIQVTERCVGYPGVYNWTQAATQITLKAGVIAYDSSWTNDSVLLPLTVQGGTVYSEYRALNPTNARAIQEVVESGDIAAATGVISTDNPLAYGLFKAVQNANGTVVRFIGLEADDLTDGWANALEVLKGRDDVYTITPMSWDRDVQNLFAAHIAGMSSPEEGKWRGTFLSAKLESSIGIYVGTDEDPVLATITDDPDATGSQYTLVTVAGGEFLTQNVQSGDIVRCKYTGDGWDGVAYEEYVVDAVLNEESLRLYSGPTSPVTTPSKIEVWHNRTKAEAAVSVATDAGSFGSRRVCFVWPDYPITGGVAVEGFYLCAALAGLRSGVVPHQGLTNVSVAGFDDLSRSNEYFNHLQLNTMAEGGVWIVTQAPNGGAVYTRHQLTTDVTSVSTREQSITTNVDSISYLLKRRIAPYIGRANITDASLAKLESEIRDALLFFMTPYTDTLGPQLITFKILEVSQHPVMKDRVIVRVRLTVPYPMNNVEMHLVV